MITSMKKRNHPLGCEPHKTKVSFNKARSGRLTREDEVMICVGLPLVHSPSLSASTLIVAIVGTDSRPHHSLVRGSHNPPSVGSRRLAATGSGNKSAGGGSSRSDAAATPGATVGRSLRASSRLERGAVRLGRSDHRVSAATIPASIYCPPWVWRQWTARRFRPGRNVARAAAWIGTASS